MCSERALRVLAEVEHPRPEAVPREKYNRWLDNLSEAKFTYIVAAQVGESVGRVEKGRGGEAEVGGGWVRTRSGARRPPPPKGFTHVLTPLLAAQMYGKYRYSSDIKERYMASCIEALLDRCEQPEGGGIHVVSGLYVCTGSRRPLGTKGAFFFREEEGLGEGAAGPLGGGYLHG